MKNDTKIFVLEGPDLAGKSSFALQLQKHIRDGGNEAEIRHFGPPTERTPLQLFSRYVDEIRWVADLAHSNPAIYFIFDRLHVGELIYGPILRGKSILSEQHIKVIDMALDEVGARKFFIDAPDETLLKRYKMRGDPLVAENEIIDIAHTYRNIVDPPEYYEGIVLDGWERIESGQEVWL